MITHLGHVAYSVSNLDAALDFYCTKLGLAEAFRLYHDDATVWIVYILVGQGGFIELFPGGKPDAGTIEGSYRHLCLAVDDMEATLADLKARGLPLTGEPNRGKDGNVQFWLTTPTATVSN